MSLTEGETGRNPEQYKAPSPESVVNFIKPEFGVVTDFSAVLDEKPDSEGNRFATFTRKLKPYKSFTETDDEKEESLIVEVKDLNRTVDWILQQLNEFNEMDYLWTNRHAKRRYWRLVDTGFTINSLINYNKLPRPDSTLKSNTAESALQ